MRIRLIAATAGTLLLIAAPVSAQSLSDNPGSDNIPAQTSPDTLPEQAENRAGNAEGADERRVDDEHRAEESDVRDERADAGAGNAEGADERRVDDEHRAEESDVRDERADAGADNAEQGLQTAEDAQDNGRDFGEDRSGERGGEHTTDEVDVDALDALDEVDLDVPEEADGAFATVLQSLTSAVDWIQERISALFA